MQSYEQNPWLLHLIAKLLAGDPLAYGLLRSDAPFQPGMGARPTFIRAQLWRYTYTRLGSSAGECGWVREGGGGGVHR